MVKTHVLFGACFLILSVRLSPLRPAFPFSPLLPVCTRLTRVALACCASRAQTAGALLLTWSVWWLAVVGSSVPARRPFFKAADVVPVLVKERAQLDAEGCVRVLAGGRVAVCEFLRAHLRRFFAVLAAASVLAAALLAPFWRADRGKGGGECEGQMSSFDAF